jgi:phosphoribosyl-AMP cyclohydrolase / phosphoribosyl-ATP pyrophosphohydrolase
MIIPSIDLLDGQAVQLKQGKEKVIARDDVFELLERFSLYGEVAVIDLNAALGTGDNKALIKEMLKRQPCRVGGGIRDQKVAEEYLKAGATKIILGTAAREAFVQQLPKQRLIFAIDAKGDNWVTHGWTQDSAIKVTDILPELAQNCSEFLYTQVEKEGMMQGIDSQRIAEIVKASPIPVTVAGGITTVQDVSELARLEANMQLGMAVYTGALDLNEAMIASINFDKCNGLVPTVVQDADTLQVLMMAYSSQESLLLALRQRQGVYFSRSQNALWEKGATSGNRQRLVKVDSDCDGDTIVFQVKQVNNACHLDRYSCFPTQNKRFSLESLDRILEQRQQSKDMSSFSYQVMSNDDLSVEKLREECEELIEATEYDEVRWEAADLIYFTLLNARSKGVGVEAILQELKLRNGE